jgi:DhnA family fructose-bisphosphate aldolase class Ia
MPFDPCQILSGRAIAQITDARVDDPGLPLRLARHRRRRAKLTTNGKLNILAADHPARRVTSAPGDPLGMANRGEFLARILRVLESSRVDGVMATMDVLEELLIADSILGRGLLHDRVMIPSINRGGLAGVSWEIDDPPTGAAPQTCADWNMDGAKLLLRICDDDFGSLKTMLACADAITRLNALDLPTFLEPLVVTRTEKGFPVVKEAAALAKLAGVSSALGDSSRYLWLKLPACPNYEIVARSTTLPILLLGGESSGDPRPFLEELATCLSAGPNVRGALVGRNVLYPGDADPLKIAEAAGLIIHDGLSPSDVVRG